MARALARLAHQECCGPGVGAIGMCFTGNFALTMMLEPSMLAPVLSQPVATANDPAGLEIAPDELRSGPGQARTGRSDRSGISLRGRPFCKAQRFAAYAEALGDRFIARVLPDSAANTDVAPFFEHGGLPHSVVTAHLIDEAGQPTIAARDKSCRSSPIGSLPGALRSATLPLATIFADHPVKQGRQPWQRAFTK